MSDFFFSIYPVLMYGFIYFIYAGICMGICKSILSKKGYPKNKNFGYIIAFLLGIIGIIVCAIMPPYHDENEIPKAGNADELLKYKQLLDSDVITKEEFEKKKQELLK